MTHIRRSRPRPLGRPPKPRARLQVEMLEARNLLATSTFALTTPSQVSGDSPLAAPPPSPPSPPPLFSYNSEVEPQIAVDPTHPSYAVAIWQQDRFFKVGGARALLVSVTTDADLQTG